MLTTAAVMVMAMAMVIALLKIEAEAEATAKLSVCDTTAGISILRLPFYRNNRDCNELFPNEPN
jgi:hypothetical protein